MLLMDGLICAVSDFLIAQLIKNPPAMQETLVRSLGQEEPLEKGNPLQYSCLNTEEPGRLQSLESQSRM